MNSLKFSHFAFLLAFLASIIFAANGLAQNSPEEIKERMKKNLPAIEKLKKSGVVGENNKGFLEARVKDLPGKEKALMETENKDRKWVYEYLAKQTNTDIKKVQALRAAQIRERSAKGLWLQSPEGEWYLKKEDPK